MKRIIGSLALLGVLLSGSWSRPAAAFAAGAHLGLNFATASTPSNNSVGTTTRFIGGGFLEGDLGLLYIQPEANYVGRGNGTDFLAIPVFLKVKIPLGLCTPFVMAGPDAGFKISGSQAVKGFDFGVDIGGGIEFKMMPAVHLVFDLRYYLGLTNVVDQAILPGQELKFRGFQVLGGLAFGI